MNGVDIAKVKDPRRLTRGLMAHQRGEYLTAAEIYRKLILKHRGHPEAMYLLALVLYAIHELPRTVELLSKVIQGRPQWPEPYYNLGVAYQSLGDDAKAEMCFRAALELGADTNIAPACYTNLGSALIGLGRPHEAILSYQQATAVDAHSHEAIYNRSLARFLLGDWREAWREYEHRIYTTGFLATNPQWSWAPQWLGDPLEGKTILLFGEQGHGDTLMCLRYVQKVRLAGAGRVVLQIQPALKTLVQYTVAADPFDVVADGETCPSWDVCCSLMSLPGIFETTVDTVPHADGYLAGPLRRDRGAGTLRIGFVWAGSKDNRNDLRRSTTLEQWAPLFALPGLEWVSLQVGREEEPPAQVVRPELRDFADTAAAIADCDLILSVDTAVAHLAGAMGVPVWILLGGWPDWRWMLEGDVTPWYRSARLFRHAKPGDWPNVFARVLTALEAWIP